LHDYKPVKKKYLCCISIYRFWTLPTHIRSHTWAGTRRHRTSSVQNHRS